MEEQLVCVGRYFSLFLSLLPRRLEAWLNACLFHADATANGREWWLYCFGIFALGCMLFPALLLFLFSAAKIPLIYAPVAGVLFALSCFLFLLCEPWLEAKKYQEELEADMSLGLLVLGIDVESGERLRQGLFRISAGGYGHFSKEIGRVLREEAGGASLPESLDGLAGKAGSVYVKRAVMAMKNAYRTGEGKALKMIAEELLVRNENQLREYTSKSGLLSQAATVFTVVLPTMVVCLVMIAAVIKAPAMPPPVLSILIGFGFTFFAVVLYQYQLKSVPVFIKRLYKGEKLGWGSFREKVDALGDVKYGRKVFVLLIVATFFCFALFNFAFGLFQGLLAGLSALLFSAGFGLLYPFLKFEEVRRGIEDELPLMLEQAAQFADRRGEDVLKVMGGMGHGELDRRFSCAAQEIRAGGTLRVSLMKVAEDVKSELLRQALELIVRSYELGVDMRDAFRETARFIQKVKFIFQESRAATFGERATQLFGFLIAAFLFGVVVSMGRGLGELLSGGFFEVDTGVLEAVVTGIRINLLVQPFVISFSVANLEGDMKRFLLYLPALLLVGNLLFLFAGGLNLL